MLVAPQQPFGTDALVAAVAADVVLALRDGRGVLQLAGVEGEGPGAIGDVVVERHALAVAGGVDYRPGQ
ncbi:hypothetical protein D3C76_1389620 [compost metagenome]